MELDMELSLRVYDRATELFFEHPSIYVPECVERAADELGMELTQILRARMEGSLKKAMITHFLDKHVEATLPGKLEPPPVADLAEIRKQRLESDQESTLASS